MSDILIDKENIQQYKIIHADKDRSQELQDKLLAAQRLGNEFKSKVSILFQTEEGPKRVETTVWSATEKYIQLKNGIHIPLTSIIEIDY